MWGDGMWGRLGHDGERLTNNNHDGHGLPGAAQPETDSSRREAEDLTTEATENTEEVTEKVRGKNHGHLSGGEGLTRRNAKCD
jgi:hypothetical protein